MLRLAPFQRMSDTLLSRHRRILSVLLISLPSCAWPTTRLLIGNPYTWNGSLRAHWCWRANVIWKRWRQIRAHLRLIEPAGAGERTCLKRWRPSSPSLAPRTGREEAGVLPSYPRIAQKQADQEQPVAGSSLPTLAKRQLDREEITVLLKVGKDLIASGDIAAARLTLKRAADAGDAEAALALASTYDPYVLRELKVYGFPADAAMARAWYEKAKDLGSPVAPRRLEMLARGAR